MNEYQYRATKILEKINELASISEDEHCITRRFGSEKFMEGANKVMQWMKEAGLQARIDNIGNVRGKLLCDDTAAKTLVLASHIDTVINAGKFDGPLGVIMGLDLIDHLIQSKTKIPFHIELIAFSDEEGVRFHTTYLGSKIVAGNFDKTLLDKKDLEGITLQEAIEKIGGDPNQLFDDVIPQKDWLGYFEIHIEQGPVLYERNIPVAVVDSIVGQRRAEIRLKGIAGHAGTVPMNMRNDALTCAAEFILDIEKFAKENKIVATVGKLDITHAATNVIPGEVVCSLDLRSPDENVLSTAYEAIKNKCQAICSYRNIGVDWNLIQETRSTICDKDMKELLARSIKDAGYELVHLVSGAGHDAVAISKVSPAAILFVRCFKGISHNPLENVELNDIAAAIFVCDNFIQQMIDQNNS
ncbi:MAG TPA: allantoate amidohydrolase [Chitinophagaceae bacterium]|jgi:allantoate deiminase|nr:allantoate amidohydrolase [Chitinophagaceae bacterium]